MKLKPLHDRVIVQPKDLETKTPGGIIIPDGNTEKPLEGEVVAIGPGVLSNEGKFVETVIKVGTQVLFSKHCGTELKIDGKDCIIMRESDLIAEMI